MSLAAVVALLGGLTLHLILHRDVSVVPSMQILALVLPIRFLSFAQTVAIVRAARQKARVPYLAASLAVLLVGGILGGTRSSLVLLALARVVAELCIVGGYTLVVHRLPAPQIAPGTA
jgi:O-antigen/teichoic acid export membrane protein